MEIEEVDDRKSLNAYLETLEDDHRLLTARVVAFRAGARVLPIALKHYFSETISDGSVVPLFGALAVGGIASHYPTPYFDHAAALGAAYAANKIYSETVSSYVGNAAYSAAYSAFSAVATIEAAHDASVSVYAASNAADSGETGFWDAARTDLSWKQENSDLSDAGLWPEASEPETIRGAWEKAKRQMSAASSADWSFWILWYERVRDGRDFHADKLAEILNALREEDWKRGPAHINPKFDDLLALYREEDAELDALRDEANALLAERPTQTTVASVAQRSHNMPPELVEIETTVLRQTEIIWNEIGEAKRELDQPNPDKDRLRHIALKIGDILRETIVYCGKVADASVMAAAKVGGGAAGTFLLDHYINSGRLMDFVERLLGFVG